MSPIRAVTGGAVLLLIAGTAACGLGSVAPKIELRDAVAAVGDARTASFTVSLPSSPADMRAFLAAGGEDDSAIDDELLRQLHDAELVADTDTGKNKDKTTDDAMRVQVRLGNKTYGELRAVDEQAYLRVDLAGLTEQFPEMADSVDEFRTGVDSGDMGMLQEPAEAALDGKWVSVDTKEMSKLAEEQGGTTTPSTLPDAFGRKARDLVGKAFGKTASVRKAGEDDTGDRLVATVNLRDFYAQVSKQLPDLLDELPIPADEPLPPADEVPDRDVSASFWVNDGELRRVELDLAQFLDEPEGHLVVRADVAGGKPVTAPKGAVAVDLEQLAALEGAASGVDAGDFADWDVEDVAMAVGSEFASYAEYAGEGPSIDQYPIVAQSFTGMTPPVQLKVVGDRVQVTHAGDVACLTLGTDAAPEGTVASGPC